MITKSEIIHGRRVIRAVIGLLRDARSQSKPEEEYLKALRKIIPLRNGN